MKIDIKRFKFYLWVGSAYLLMWLFIELISHPETFLKRAADDIWLISYITVMNYLFFEYALPFIKKANWKRILAAPFILFGFLLLLCVGLYIWRIIGIQLHIYFPLKVYPSVLSDIFDHCQYCIPSIFFFGVIKHVYDFRKLRETAQQLRIEKQQAELNYLKSQTNPHFLFNTLNNIYSLAKDKSDLAPESILRLSQILRFMLYETGGEYIPIEQEVKIISDYIALEQLRYDETLSVNFKYEIEDQKQKLPPLLMIPLVENAFKHGVSETRNKPFVDIYLSTTMQQLLFVVKNSVEASTEGKSAKKNIGLSNLRRQLELLYKEFNLSVQQSDSQFTATLKINLTTHV